MGREASGSDYASAREAASDLEGAEADASGGAEAVSASAGVEAGTRACKGVHGSGDGLAGTGGGRRFVSQGNRAAGRTTSGRPATSTRRGRGPCGALLALLAFLGFIVSRYALASSRRSVTVCAPSRGLL